MTATFSGTQQQFHSISELISMSHEATRGSASSPWEERAREMAQSVDDERIQKAIERKRLYSSKGMKLAPQSQGVRRLFDHFYAADFVHLPGDARRFGLGGDYTGC